MFLYTVLHIGQGKPDDDLLNMSTEVEDNVVHALSCSVESFDLRGFIRASFTIGEL